MRAEAKKFSSQTIPTMPDGVWVDPHFPKLYLWVRNGGASRVWKMRMTHKGKTYEISLGPVKTVSLKQAREKVTGHEAVILAGGDPKAKRTGPAENTGSTFRADSSSFYAYKKGEWSKLHAKYWWQKMERHVFPLVGETDTAMIKVDDVVSVLLPLWRDKNRTAIHLHGMIKVVIDYAMDCDDDGRFTGNPAIRALRRLPLGCKRDQTPHATITWQEAPTLYKTLAARNDQAATALRFLLLCGTPRAAEVIGAKWSEVTWPDDVEAGSTHAGVWHVPAARMKSGRARDIPLSHAALELLASLTTPRDGFIFTGRLGKMVGGTVYGRARERIGGTFVPFSGAIHCDAMQKLLRDDLKMKCRVHGLRATFRTWASDHATTVRDHDAAEICLDHVIGNRVHRSYDRADMLSERRLLLGRWAEFLGA